MTGVTGSKHGATGWIENKLDRSTDGRSKHTAMWSMLRWHDASSVRIPCILSLTSGMCILELLTDDKTSIRTHVTTAHQERHFAADATLYTSSHANALSTAAELEAVAASKSFWHATSLRTNSRGTRIKIHPSSSIQHCKREQCFLLLVRTGHNEFRGTFARRLPYNVNGAMWSPP